MQTITAFGPITASERPKQAEEANKTKAQGFPSEDQRLSNKQESKTKIQNNPSNETNKAPNEAETQTQPFRPGTYLYKIVRSILKWLQNCWKSTTKRDYANPDPK